MSDSKRDTLELIKAYDDFAHAANALTECIRNRNGEDADCSEEYPFDQSFDEVASNIRVWSSFAIRRLDKEINKPITIMPLNDVHMDQKVRMNSTELDLLKCASFEDNSWGDDECPSFHRDSRYNKDHFYEIYVCYVILDGKTKGNYHVRPIITAMYNKEETLLNVDGQDYFHEVSEAIIACVKHDEETNRSRRSRCG